MKEQISALVGSLLLLFSSSSQNYLTQKTTGSAGYGINKQIEFSLIKNTSVWENEIRWNIKGKLQVQDGGKSLTYKPVCADFNANESVFIVKPDNNSNSGSPDLWVRIKDNGSSQKKTDTLNIQNISPDDESLVCNKLWEIPEGKQITQGNIVVHAAKGMNIPTPTIIQTPSETPTPSLTPVPTITPEPTSTPADTPVPTQMPTQTPAPSPTPGDPPAPTMTPAPTSTLTPTFTPSPTLEPSPTPTFTPTPTATPTSTDTIAPTPTDTPFPTFTPTAMPSPSETPAPTLTVTPLITPTPENAPTPTPLPSAQWYPGYLSRIPLIINHSAITENLSDFPVYINLGDLGSGFFTDVASDGSDILITSSDGLTKLPRELVSIDATAKTGELYFKAPLLSSVTDNIFYLYYGGNAQNNDTATWNSNFLHVYHLETLSDSKGTLDLINNTSAPQTSVKIGKGIELTDHGSYMRFGSSNISLNGNWSLQWWSQRTNNDANNVIFNKAGSNIAYVNYYNYMMDIWHDNGKLGTWTDVQNLNDLDFWVLTNDGSAGGKAVLYENGIALSSFDSAGSNSVSIGEIGRSFDSVNSLVGKIDEIRFSNNVLPPAWIDADYLNQNSPSLFYTIGTKQIASSPFSAFKFLASLNYFIF